MLTTELLGFHEHCGRPIQEGKVCAGHCRSVTRTITNSNELFEFHHPEIDWLQKEKPALTKKIEVLSCLDSEILEMVSAKEVAGEIEQLDKFKDGINVVLVKINCSLLSATTTAMTTPLLRLYRGAKVVL